MVYGKVFDPVQLVVVDVCVGKEAFFDFSCEHTNSPLIVMNALGDVCAHFSGCAVSENLCADEV